MPSTTDVYDGLHIPTIHFNTTMPSTTDFIFQSFTLIPQCRLPQTSTTAFIFQPFILIPQCRLLQTSTTDFIFQPFRCFLSVPIIRRSQHTGQEQPHQPASKAAAHAVVKDGGACRTRWSTARPSSRSSTSRAPFWCFPFHLCSYPLSTASLWGLPSVPVPKPALRLEFELQRPSFFCLWLRAGLHYILFLWISLCSRKRIVYAYNQQTPLKVEISEPKNIYFRTWSEEEE